MYIINATKSVNLEYNLLILLLNKIMIENVEQSFHSTFSINFSTQDFALISLDKHQK